MSTLPAPTEFPDLPGVTHRFVTARGLRVHVAEAGQGEPLVLQHVVCETEPERAAARLVEFLSARHPKAITAV
jgi:hypothetical protein